MKDAELSQHRSAVVIDFLSLQAIIGVEGVNTAKRELDAPPSRRKTTPSAEVRAANDDLNQDGVVRDMAALHLDFQVRQRLHELLIKLTDASSTLVVFTPRLILVECGITESAENTFEVVLVLTSDVLLNECDTSRLPFVRYGCSCQLTYCVSICGRECKLQILQPPPFFQGAQISHFAERQQKSPSRPLPGWGLFLCGTSHTEWFYGKFHGGPAWAALITPSPVTRS